MCSVCMEFLRINLPFLMAEIPRALLLLLVWQCRTFPSAVTYVGLDALSLAFPLHVADTTVLLFEKYESEWRRNWETQTLWSVC